MDESLTSLLVRDPNEVFSRAVGEEVEFYRVYREELEGNTTRYTTINYEDQIVNVTLSPTRSYVLEAMRKIAAARAHAGS